MQPKGWLPWYYCAYCKNNKGRAREMKSPNKGSPPSPLADKRDHAGGCSTASVRWHILSFSFFFFFCRNQKQWIKKEISGETSLAVQWLRHYSSNVGGMGATPGQGTKILHAAWCSQNTEKKKYIKKEIWILICTWNWSSIWFCLENKSCGSC